MRTYGTSETFNVTPSRIVNIIMLNMLVGMKDSNVKYVINDLAASQDKKNKGQLDDMGWLGWNGGQSKEGVGGADNHLTPLRRYLCLCP